MEEKEPKLEQEPAFPSKGSANCTTLSGYTSYQNLKFEGMSKRFYAACTAMQGLISHYGVSYEESHAQKAFYFADELLKQENSL